MAKRRVGLGFTGLGDALIDAAACATTRAEARAMAAKISEFMRDRAYARLGRAREGARRLPAVQRRPVPVGRQLRLAPAAGDQGRRSASTASATRTCCRSRPPAPSASPSPTTPPTASSRRSRGPTRARSAWPTARTRSSASRTTPGASTATCTASDAKLPDYFVTALEISAEAHKEMVAAVAPFIDTSISKTVNVPEDYPYARVRGPLPRRRGRRGSRASRPTGPNTVLGAVLSRRRRRRKRPQAVEPVDGANRRLAIKALPAAGAREPALAGPPRAARGQPRVDLHDRVALRALRAVRRPRRARPAARSRSRSG